MGRIFKSIIILALVSVLIWWCSFLFKFISVSTEFVDYNDFKKSTEIVEGKVTNVEISKKMILKDEYFLVIKSNSASKRVKVNEMQYNNYQEGSHVKFRVKLKNNEVIIDLNKDKDIENEKEYKQRLKQKI
ncbi:hypothetical protein ACEE94_10660 [Staphylococcus epidermidis]